MRRFIEPARLLLLTALLAATPVPAAAPADGARVTLKSADEPSRLALLARQLETADQDRQWEFAAIMLDVLLDAYESELRAAMHEHTSTPARTAKLSRWRRATRGLTAQLEAARLRLAEGATLSLYVDPRGQILLIIDGQAVVASGPRGMSDDAITATVLDQYCAYNDCSALHAESPSSGTTGPMITGTWVLRQEMRPSYELDHELACEFESLEDRERKAQLCVALATEMAQIEEALRQAIRQGFFVDWRMLLVSPPGATAPYIVLNRHGDHLRQELQLLNKVDGDEWQDVLEWIRHGLEDNQRNLLILRTDRFLPD